MALFIRSRVASFDDCKPSSSQTGLVDFISERIPITSSERQSGLVEIATPATSGMRAPAYMLLSWSTDPWVLVFIWK